MSAHGGSALYRLLRPLWDHKVYTLWGIFFHILTAILTIVSLPLVIPFFQILFNISPSQYSSPESMWDLEGVLNYGFSRLIAMTDQMIALWIVCILVVVIFFLKNLCRFLISFFMVYVRNRLLLDLRKKVWAGYEQLSLTQRYDKKQGYLVSLITNDLMEVDHGILKVFELLFKTPLVIMGSLLFMAWLSPQLMLITVGLILFTLIIIGGISHVLKKASSKAQDSLSAMTILVDQYLSATKMIRTHHADGLFSRRFDIHNENYFDVTTKILRRRDLASPLAEFLGVVTVVVLLFYGTHAVFNDEIQPESFFAFIFAFYNIIDPAKSFSREYANVQKGMAALDRIDDFLMEVSQSASLFKGDEKGVLSRQIHMSHIHFGYSADQALIDNMSLQINKGEKVGIVGDSGVGKTTLIDLLLGFYSPLSGDILIDDIPISHFNESSYRQLFGLVSQRPQLFFGSISDNITMDLPSDDLKLKKLCDRLDISSDLLSQQVGDHATRISGGESQRISLARALYRNPDILILDEPTSQLDITSATTLIDQIISNTQDKTVIMITHQVKMLKKADRIIFLDQGNIQAQGQYQDLYNRNVSFRRLVDEYRTI